MDTTRRALLSRLSLRGLHDLEAERALLATLAVLGERLPEEDAARVALALPAELAPLVRDVRHHAIDESHRAQALADLVERVRHIEHTTGDRAREHVDIVCEALARALPDDVVRELERGLPPWLFHRPLDASG